MTLNKDRLEETLEKLVDKFQIKKTLYAGVILQLKNQLIQAAETNPEIVEKWIKWIRDAARYILNDLDQVK